MYNPFTQTVTYNPFDVSDTEPITINQEQVVVESVLLGGHHTEIWYN